MRTREKNFVDGEKRKIVYSFQILWKGEWLFVSDGKGEIKKFETRKECDVARAEYREKPTVSA
jgi:hypothetical protein